MDAVLAAQSIYGGVGRVRLIHDVNLSVAAGECVALVGPNGAGKTTFMRTLAGDLPPHAGQILLGGLPLKSYCARKLSERRAVLSQHVETAFAFSVEDIVRLGAGDRASQQVNALVETKLAELDLTALRPRAITTLSGGEQQRTHFARVLLQLALGEAEHGPGLLLLDEPTSSLDLKHQIGILKTARAYAARGTAVIAILHDLNLAAMFADRIVVMKAGRVAHEGPPSSVITSAMLHDVYGVETDVNTPPAGLPFVLPQLVGR